MFKENPAAKQHSLRDPYHGFPQYVKEALHKSWAEPFFSSIFTRIKEDRFSLLGTERYQALADFRAGVEGVPSVLRRAYDIDGPPVRGLVPTSIWDHFKVMAYNFRSYYSYYQRTGQRGPSFAFILPCLKRLFWFNRPRLCYCG